MRKPTKEELTALLQTWKFSCEKDCEKECNVEFMEDECKPCFDAIRHLIEKWFDVKERAAYELANIALGEESNGERILSALRLLEEIRDFGLEVEEKEEGGE